MGIFRSGGCVEDGSVKPRRAVKKEEMIAAGMDYEIERVNCLGRVESIHVWLQVRREPNPIYSRPL